MLHGPIQKHFKSFAFISTRSVSKTFLTSSEGSSQDTQSLCFSLPHAPSVFLMHFWPYYTPWVLIQLLIMNLTSLVSSNPKVISTWNKDTHGWQSLTRSWSVVPGWRPRMYRLVLLSWSPPLLLPLLLLVVVLGLGGAICWVEDAYACCKNRDKTRLNSIRFKSQRSFL